MILLAAGQGERLGLGTPKALVSAGSRPILSHALETLVKLRPSEVIVTAPRGRIEDVENLVQGFAWPNTRVSVLEGGVTRQDSVGVALSQVTAPFVLVHDSARCFAPPSLFERVLRTTTESRAAVIPGIAVADTIKQVKDSKVLGTLQRDELVSVQTPQGFPTEILRAAHAKAQKVFTDDAALAEASGISIVVVEGDPEAKKITTLADLNATAARSVGIGMDSHRFGVTGVLRLACAEWPGLPALEGHSDGDAAAHALVDALLSAAGLGDIGTQFGVDRSEYAGANGERFLLETKRLLDENGWLIENASVQIMADIPKIAPRRLELEETLAKVLSVPVRVAATSTDGLGFLSDARGVGAVATALLRRKS